MPRRRRIPGICYHKAARRYYVNLDGEEIWLSEQIQPTDSPPLDVQAEYDRRLARWLAARAVLPEPVAPDPTLDELWLGYLSYIEGGLKYKKNGKPTTEVQLIKDACRVAARLFGTEPARDFGTQKLEAVRAVFLERGWTRETINKAVHRVKRMFRWGAHHDLVPESIWRRLQTVPDLTPDEYPHGNQKVPEVKVADLEASLPYLPANLRSMVQAHRLIGCRAQEIVVARTMDFDQEADRDDVAAELRCWLFTPTESKTGAAYWVGPAAQTILRPWLLPDQPAAWLFPTRRRGKGCWTTASYRRHIARCCAKNNLPRWSPLMVRHAAAEEARRFHEKGIEATQARLRHKHVNVSELYAHNLDPLGRDVARRFG